MEPGTVGALFDDVAAEVQGHIRAVRDALGEVKQIAQMNHNAYHGRPSITWRECDKPSCRRAQSTIDQYGATYDVR